MASFTARPTIIDTVRRSHQFENLSRNQITLINYRRNQVNELFMLSIQKERKSLKYICRFEINKETISKIFSIFGKIIDDLHVHSESYFGQSKLFRQTGSFSMFNKIDVITFLGEVSTFYNTTVHIYIIKKEIISRN